MSNRLTARPATPIDIRVFYPEETCSFRAWVVELDGELQGVIGVALSLPTACMFSTFHEPLRPWLKHPTVLRLIKKAEAAVKASRVPVVALAEPKERTAPKILERLGFKHVGCGDAGEIYAYYGGPLHGRMAEGAV